MREVKACRERFPHHYVKVIAYDARYTRQTTALAFIVVRPREEPGFRLERTDKTDRSLDKVAATGVASRSAPGEIDRFLGAARQLLRQPNVRRRVFVDSLGPVPVDDLGEAVRSRVVGRDATAEVVE